MKVFCADCIFYQGEDYYPNRVVPRCTHLSNIKEKTVETWYNSTISRKYIKDPSQLNKNNDCKNYKKRRWGE